MLVRRLDLAPGVDFQLLAQSVRLGRTSTILRSLARGGHRREFLGVEFLAFGDPRRWSRAARVLAFEGQHVAGDEHAAPGIHLVMVDDHFADLAGVELEQVRLDPVGELGREVRLDVDLQIRFWPGTRT